MSEAEDQTRICGSLGCDVVGEPQIHKVTCPRFATNDEITASEVKERIDAINEKIGEMDIANDEPVDESLEKGPLPEQEHAEVLKKWEESVRVELKRRGFSEDHAKHILYSHHRVIRERRAAEYFAELERGDRETKELKARFTYHPPKQDQKGRYIMLRDFGMEFAELIYDNCPESRERALAITKLEEVVMWANASIARRE